MKTGGHKGILCAYLLSLPARGAWIEILKFNCHCFALRVSLPARGAWIEIVSSTIYTGTPPRRSLRGERGLKYAGSKPKHLHEGVAPCEGSVD